MSVRITIVDGPVGAALSDSPELAPPAQPESALVDTGEAGAVVTFDGVVRALEGDRKIQALDYEVYEPMASRELGRLAADLLGSCGVLAIDAWHSRGRVQVGAVSFRLVVRSAHRKEALQAMDRFIDCMKRDVPIWKRAVW
jgi:molybdopterin synthase catalytic subunit